MQSNDNFWAEKINNTYDNMRNASYQNELPWFWIYSAALNDFILHFLSL